MRGTQAVRTERHSASACPVCVSSDVAVILEIPRVPIHCNLLWLTRAEALGAPMGNIRLASCGSCGHLFNLAFEPELMEYTQAYESSLHFSPRFQRYAVSLATRLIERHSLYGKEVIEIGCGKGDFLKLLCELGDNNGIGFDPSYVPDGTYQQPGRITFIQDLYTDRYAHYKADLICCRHVLEHIQSPTDFLTTLRRAIDGRQDTVLFFEVPNVLFTLRDLGIWDLIYEHCSYFSPGSLARAFTSCGFGIHELTEEYEGQFLGIEALPSENSGGPGKESGPDLGQISTLVSGFSKTYRSKLESWIGRLEKIARAGQTAVVWGAGSKGVTFLNTLKITDQIGYVVDINPRKHGTYVGGTGQEIVSPEVLMEIQPDVVIVMNSIYETEIRELVDGIGLNTELICA